MQSLTQNNLKRLRVSSTLNKNTREFGKDFMIDGNDETCWNSHQGSPQSISMEFKEASILNNVQIMFQGGFTGKNCEFWVRRCGQDNLTLLKSFYPEDKNTMQKFDLTSDSSNPITELKIVFLDSTDFYGRITIYRLDVIGSIVPSE